jgi:hypothetical protein
MPDTPTALVSAHLWDLRAQCEQQVRALNDAQQQLDIFRDGTDGPACHAAAQAVEADLSRVLTASATVRQAAEQALEHARALVSVAASRPGQSV